MQNESNFGVNLFIYLFIETRVNGQPHIWDIVKKAVYAPNGNKYNLFLDQIGLSLLYENKISMLNNSVQMCVDSRFNKYEVPIFCIN